MRKNRPRLEHAAYAGAAAALLTFCTAERRHVFTTSDAVERALSQFLRAESETHVSLLAYCFMPDHVHLLVQTSDDSGDIGRFVRRGKQYSGYLHSRATGQRLWQPSWHDRVVRRSDDLVAIIRYVVQNPIRASLVDDVRAYPYLGSSIMTREELLDSVWADSQA